MIERLCHDGVEQKKLEEIATINRGGNFQKKHFCEIGIPCIHYGEIYTKYGLFADKTFSFIDSETAKKQKYASKNDIIMAVTSENIEDVCKCVAWLGEEKIAVSGHTAIIHHNQNAKYLIYFFYSSIFQKQKIKIAHGTKVIEVTPNDLNEIVIPVPPIEIQEKIVNMLDNFIELSELLKRESELRQKQYDYYREKIYSNLKGVKK